jgi:predicted nucleotidyltransferase
MKENLLEIISKEVEQNLDVILKDKLKKIILYGSYARGDYDEESDIDFLVLTDLKNDEISYYRNKITDLTVELSLKYGKLASIVLKNENQFREYFAILPFYSNVVNDGKVIYG